MRLSALLRGDGRRRPREGALGQLQLQPGGLEERLGRRQEPHTLDVEDEP